MTKNLDKKFSYRNICNFFFSQIGVPSVRATVLADASIKVKITFQNSNFLCGFQGVHCCSFRICVCGCLKMSVFSKKILRMNAIFCGYAKKKRLIKLFLKKCNLDFHQEI